MQAPSFAKARTVILFFVGVGGVLYELIVTGTDRPALLVLLGTFAGLPLVVSADKLMKKVGPLLPKTEIEPSAPDNTKKELS